MLCYHEKNIGEFRNQYDKHYTYRKTDDAWALANGFEHEIDIFDGVRFANVKNTVVYVCVDEDENGPVVEKWKLKKHGVYA